MTKTARTTTVERHQPPAETANVEQRPSGADIRRAAAAAGAAPEPTLVTVRALVSHDTMRVGSLATVPYTPRVQRLIESGYLDAAVDDDPLSWMAIE